MLAKLPVLETERLVLRSFELTDAPAVQVLLSDYEIADTMISIPHPYPENGAISWIGTHPSGMENGLYPFALIRKQDGALLGTISIKINVKHNKGELGYWVGVPYWNQGFAGRLRSVCFSGRSTILESTEYLRATCCAIRRRLECCRKPV